MKTYKIKNVNCINCVNLIKNSLEDEFGNLDINVDAKTISVFFDEKDGFDLKIIEFKKELDELGFELVLE